MLGAYASFALPDDQDSLRWVNFRVQELTILSILDDDHYDGLCQRILLPKCTIQNKLLKKAFQNCVYKEMPRTPSESEFTYSWNTKFHWKLAYVEFSFTQIHVFVENYFRLYYRWIDGSTFSTNFVEFLGNNILLVSDYSAHAMMPAGMTWYHPHCDMWDNCLFCCCKDKVIAAWIAF